MENRTILIVDDNPDDVSFVKRALQRSGVPCNAEAAFDGAEALDRLLGRDGWQMPRLVLLDLKMPRVDGFQVLEELRADPRGAHVPVIVFSSSTEECDVARAKRLGATSFVRKPVDYGRFTATVRALAAYWLDVDLAFPAAQEPLPTGPTMAHGVH